MKIADLIHDFLLDNGHQSRIFVNGYGYKYIKLDVTSINSITPALFITHNENIIILRWNSRPGSRLIYTLDVHDPDLLDKIIAVISEVKTLINKEKHEIPN